MRKSEEYRGCDVEVWTTEVRRGTFNWEYTIDGQHLTAGRDRPLQDEDLALNEGLQDAKMRIDGWRRAEGAAP
jgi:hypothetical protein